MIDIFIEKYSNTKVLVSFVQLGCMYICSESKADTLIDNVVTLNSEYFKEACVDSALLEYLPVTIYSRLYASDYSLKVERTCNKIPIIVKKIY